MKSNKKDTLHFLIIFLTLLIAIVISMLSGVSFIAPWKLGLILFICLVLIYYFLRKRFLGLELFFFLVFFTFWVYPTITYNLYKKNQNNYKLSNDFLQSEFQLAYDKLERNISVTDLDKIANILNDSNTVPRPKILYIIELVKLKYYNSFGYSGPWEEIIISKGDSLESVFYLRKEVPRPDLRNPDNSATVNKELSDSILDYINSIENLRMLSLGDFESIPFSEFWTEAIISFSSVDIQPSRNLTKVLNSLQIISSLFLSTILINSINDNLSVTKRKRRKKKGKKKK